MTASPMPSQECWFRPRPCWSPKPPRPTRTAGRRLDGYAKAARLSLLLWNAFPDDALLAAAAAGDLHSAAGLTRQIDRMLASPRAEVGVRAFFKDWMLYDGFDTLTKDSVIYPAFTRRIAADAEEQALRTIAYHIRNERDYRDIFTTRDIFVSRELGSIQHLAIDQRQAWKADALDARTWAALTVARAPDLPSDFATVRTTPGRTTGGRIVTTKRGATVYVFGCQEDGPDRLDCDDPADASALWTTLCGDMARCATLFRPVAPSARARPDGKVWTIVTISAPWAPVRAAEGIAGIRVWAYRGRPVFTYAADRQPGDTNGELGYQGRAWTAVDAAEISGSN